MGFMIAIAQSGSVATTYNHYYADRYACTDCGLVSSNVLVAFDSAQSVTLNRFYPTADLSSSYKILSTTLDTGGFILTTAFGSFASCSLACAV